MMRTVLAAIAALLLCAPAAPAAQVWHRAGASTFGGPCAPGEWQGYHGDDLRLTWSFAELDMGTAMGGLPYGTHVRVLDLRTHRRVNIVKRDIGLGGGAVSGVPRTVDLFWNAAHQLDPAADCGRFLDIVYWRLL